MGPALRAVLDEDLALWIDSSSTKVFLPTTWWHSPHEAAVEVVRKCSADMALDLREAVVLESLLSMLQLLELDEGEVEVLEEGPKGKNMFDKSMHEINFL